MRLYDEIFKNSEEWARERCILLLGHGGYFEGVKAVGEFSPERVELCFAKRRVIITGMDLSISKYCDGDLRLDGKIISYTLEGEGGR